jgi:hypothetical protein
MMSTPECLKPVGMGISVARDEAPNQLEPSRFRAGAKQLPGVQASHSHMLPQHLRSGFLSLQRLVALTNELSNVELCFVVYRGGIAWTATLMVLRRRDLARSDALERRFIALPVSTEHIIAVRAVLCITANLGCQRRLRVISLGGDRGRGPVYVRSTSDRVRNLVHRSERREVPTAD